MKLLPIYQKDKPVSALVRKREYAKLDARARRADGRVVQPRYCDLTDEQKAKASALVTKRQKHRYHSDPVYKKKMNLLHTLQTKRVRQRERNEVKLCSKCAKLVPLCDFELRRGLDKYAGTVRHECRFCRKARNAAYYKKGVESGTRAYTYVRKT